MFIFSAIFFFEKDCLDPNLHIQSVQLRVLSKHSSTPSHEKMKIILLLLNNNIMIYLFIYHNDELS